MNSGSATTSPICCRCTCTWLHAYRRVLEEQLLIGILVLVKRALENQETVCFPQFVAALSCSTGMASASIHEVTQSSSNHSRSGRLLKWLEVPQDVDATYKVSFTERTCLCLALVSNDHHRQIDGLTATSFQCRKSGGRTLSGRIVSIGAFQACASVPTLSDRVCLHTD